MQRLTEIRAMLDERGLRPRTSLGQNFLVDHNLIARLVARSGVGPGDLVLEVGPGTGALTEALLEAGAEVVACEVDRGLCALLRDRLGDRPGLRLVEGDALAGKRRLSAELSEALGGDRSFKLVANLPYGIATPLVMTLLIEHPQCAGVWATVQREVGDRLLAGPGSKAYGPISVVRWAVADGERIGRLGAECFWPRPEVQSVMVALRRREGARTGDARALASLAQRLFASRRKQLGGVLGRDLAWPEGVEPSMRIERVGPESIEALRRVLDAR